MNKRARERARQQKREEKQEKRGARASEDSPVMDIDEAALMAEYARLSERYSTDEITETEYVEARRQIFAELGIETDD